MLLNYIYQHYYERAEFCAAAQMDTAELARLEQANLIPKASYILDIELCAKSFVAEHQEKQSYEFYLKGQLEWLVQIANKNISTENAARHYFEAQYNAAIEVFLASELGQEIATLYPQTAWKLSDYSEIWQHFLDGTYGLCTRTGLPREIFLKHIYIRFIEFITAANQPAELTPKLKSLLSAVVDDLDKNIESNFAAHEVAKSSRQRCIINVRKEYLK